MEDVSLIHAKDNLEELIERAARGESSRRMTRASRSSVMIERRCRAARTS